MKTVDKITVSCYYYNTSVCVWIIIPASKHNKVTHTTRANNNLYYYYFCFYFFVTNVSERKVFNNFTLSKYCLRLYIKIENLKKKS
jgi:hypothetical protein